MKIKTSELTDKALRYAVALALGATGFHFDTVSTYWMVLDGKDIALNGGWAQAFKPDVDWAQGGPLMEQHGISVMRVYKDWAHPWCAEHGERGFTNAATPLLAAGRCFVASMLGDEVDVPEELCV